MIPKPNKKLTELPSDTSEPLRAALMVRTLSLACLTTHFQELWEEACNDQVYQTSPITYYHLFKSDSWSISDPQLDAEFFSKLTPHWQRNVALRSDRMRRQALVETDVLVAMAFGFTLDELLAMYRIQFPVLQKYENDTWYDAKGRIVYTSRLGQSAMPSKAVKSDNTWSIYTSARTETDIALGWSDIKDLEEGMVTHQVIDDTLPGGPVERTVEYHAPYSKCDREQDYHDSWAVFTERFSE